LFCVLENIVQGAPENIERMQLRSQTEVSDEDIDDAAPIPTDRQTGKTYCLPTRLATNL